MIKVKVSTEIWLFALVVSALLLTILLTGFNGLYGQDGHEYYRYSGVLLEYFKGNAIIENFYWTVLYPLIGTLLSLLIGHSPFSLQLVSVLAFSLSTVTLFKTLTQEKADLFLPAYLIFGFVLGPSSFKSAMQIMSDPLATFFVVTSIYLFSKFLKKPSSRGLALLAASIALATYTRYPMAVLLLPIALSALVTAIQKKLFKGMMISIVLLVVCSLPEWWLSISLKDNIESNYFLSSWSVKNLFSNSFLSVDGTLNYTLPNLIFNSGLFWHPSFCMLLPLAIFWLKKGDIKKFEVMLIIGLACYLILISGMPFQNNRMLLPAFPLALVILYKPFNRGMHWIWSKSRSISIVGLAGFILLQIAFTIYLSRIFIKRNQLEQQVSEYLSTIPTSNIYGFDLDVSMRTYLPEKKVNNLLQDTYTFEVGDLILFNQMQFDRLWSKSQIADNMNSVKVQFKLEPVQTFDQGWQLYKLVRKNN